MSFFAPYDTIDDEEIETLDGSSDEDSWPWRVLYHENDPTTFRRLNAPSTLQSDAFYGPCAVRFAAQLTLPYADGPDVWGLGLTERERDVLFGLCVDVNHGEWEEGGHYLLGHPYNLEGPALIECDTTSFAQWRKADSLVRQYIEQDVERRWRLLLQLTSSNDTDFDWDGGGVLHVCIEREALRLRDFSRIQAHTQFL